MDNAMGYLMELVQSGKINVVGEGVALLHATGQSISEDSLTNLLQSEGAFSPKDEQGIPVVVQLVKDFDSFDPLLKKLFLTPPGEGYKNPLLKKLPKYTKDTVRLAIRQYGIFLFLSIGSSMRKKFKQTTEKIDEALGSGKSSGGSLKKEVVALLNSTAKRDAFDPVLHAGLLAYARNPHVTPERVKKYLWTVFVDDTPKDRLEKVSALINDTTIEEIVKQELAELKKLG
ncbi:MAG TPA: hypothetical protein VI912_05395 [Candidatus Bilamarchaeaceae archaeon]|nr:hypothetical protein [Candidatus Bilamarchaeaceae archaeon]